MYSIQFSSIILLNILIKFRNMKIFSLFFFALVIATVLSKCAFRVDDPDALPVTLDDSNNEPFTVENYFNCEEYNNKTGCCNFNNDAQQNVSYLQINSLFGFEGGECDHCAINLKRFWCEYACSPNQANFVKVTDPNASVISPLDPSKTVNVQKVQVTIYAQTACDLYKSCKRNSFVSSVSAMGSPAGFLTFQGHNAVDQAFQLMDIKFSYNKSDSLVLSDDLKEIERASLTPCQTKVPNSTDRQKPTKWYGFIFHENCTCTSCEQACDNNSGFIYSESSVFEGFNWILVGSTYLVVGVIATILTIKRKMSKNNKDQ